MKPKIISTAYHRNGVGGQGFTVALFKMTGAGSKAFAGGGPMVAIIAGDAADKPRDRPCYVLGVEQLAAGDIAFASNSWRGDEIYHDLAPLVEKAEAERAAECAKKESRRQAAADKPNRRNIEHEERRESKKY